jgi:hypothetical protein
MNEDKPPKKVLNMKLKGKIMENKMGTTGCKRYNAEEGGKIGGN